MTVQSILKNKSSNILTVKPSQTLNDVVKILNEHKIGAVIVTSADQAVLGIISERDIVRALAKNDSPNILNETVAQHMTHKVMTCKQATPISQVMEIMTAGKFRHVPVVEQDRLIGIISIGDVVKKRLADIEAEHDALRTYIATA